MSAILVTDPTEPGFNSFVSLAEADEYFSGVYFGSSANWDELEEDTKIRLLITASRALSGLTWTGAATGTMAFPRIYSTESVVPDFVVGLVCEWAKWLWQEGPNRPGATPGEAPIVKAKLGDLEVQFSAATGGGSIPPSILSMLTPLSPTYLTIGTGARARSLTMRY